MAYGQYVSQILSAEGNIAKSPMLSPMHKTPYHMLGSSKLPHLAFHKSVLLAAFFALKQL